ncbi:MAG: hypothetical protein KC501_25820 [Myxococcales bacterium]|nr:hypothetical protein [Myxococcales bacterium]
MISTTIAGLLLALGSGPATTPDPVEAPASSRSEAEEGSPPDEDRSSTEEAPSPTEEPEPTTSDPSTAETSGDSPTEPSTPETPPPESLAGAGEPSSELASDHAPSDPADPAQDHSSPAPPPQVDEAKDAKEKKLQWSLGARLMTGWEAKYRRPLPETGEAPGWEHEFFLQQARVKFRIDYTKRFAIRASVELADALKSPDFDRVSYLRNGYARIRFHDAARLHLGYFKRPFSRLELRSPGDLPFRGRGLANGRIIEDRNYGDRSVGAMLWGRIRPARLTYYLGTFAPALRTQGVDLIGRVQADPWKWISLGASGGFKRVVNGIGESVNVGSANADFRVKIAGLYLLGDLVLGQDYLVPEEPWSLGLVGYALYDVDLPKKLVLQPMALVEWADANIEVSQNDAIRSVFGVNLVWRKRFRVMPQVELVRPRGVIDNPWTNKDTYYVMLSLEI